MADDHWNVRRFFEDTEPGAALLRSVVDAAVAQAVVPVTENVELIASAVWGTKRSVLEGGGRNEDGVIHIAKANSDALSRIEKKVSNGPNLSPAAKWTAIGVIITAVFGAVASILVALVQVTGGAMPPVP